VHALPQISMAQETNGRGARMCDFVPGEFIRDGAGRSADVRRDGVQRERWEGASNNPGLSVNPAEYR